ncbi:MAG: tetratricopeptide repeat protein [Deltaproteobacteria bacterium]|nr:tetratricopeptide repeat protein [Deltaproteobacteria bacterium]
MNAGVPPAQAAARLVSALELGGDRFQCHVIEVAGPHAGHAFRGELESVLPAGLTILWHEPEERKLWAAPTVGQLIDGLLKPLLVVRQQSPSPAVAGIDASAADPRDIDAWRNWLRRMNEARNLIASDLGLPLVLVLPAWMFPLLAREAPDLWSVRSYVALATEDADDVATALRREADTLADAGDLAGAIRLRLKEAVPIYERIGADYDKAVTLGEVAAALAVQGDLDEALRIRRQEELPAYERLGDVRSESLAWRNIASVLRQRGQFDEALRLLRERALPVLERLGDERSAAATQLNIARVVLDLGQPDEALRIAREQVLPTFERLGDVPLTALTRAWIAGVLHTLGQLDEALLILREHALPVFERLGDDHSAALTLGRIADVHQTRGQLDEALRIQREHVLPRYERLGNKPALVDACINTALVLNKRGQPDDRPEIESLLRRAYADAKHLQMPEAATIRDAFQRILDTDIDAPVPPAEPVVPAPRHLTEHPHAVTMPSADRQNPASAIDKRPAQGHNPTEPTMHDTPAQPDAEAAYQQFLPQAMALRDIQPMRADPEIAHGNVQRGVAAALALQPELQPVLPALDWVAMPNLPALAQAVVYASARVDRDAASPGEIARWRKRSAELRAMLLNAARSLADKGLLPAAEVRDIERGTGAIDSATDCVRLAGLFRAHAAVVAGKHPVEVAEVDEAAAVGTQLLAVLRPAGYKPGGKPETDADRAADIRDRLWTLLVQGYKSVRKAAYYQWGDDFGDHAPALGSRRVERAPAADGPAVPVPPA